MSKTAEPEAQQDSDQPGETEAPARDVRADLENALDIRALKEMSSADLTQVARDLDIAGASSLRKQELKIGRASCRERV